MWGVPSGFFLRAGIFDLLLFGIPGFCGFSISEKFFFRKFVEPEKLEDKL
jgi:hypothetical protein